jgi:predicted branched-subunit amino acid permease
MIFSPRFGQGLKAAIPIWIAFIPSSIAFGIAAQGHGLRLHEIILISAWVYSGPAQFAVLEPLATGKSSLQIVLAAFLINLRFLPMSAALAPFFSGVRRPVLLFSSHFISASSFVVPYLQFRKEKDSEPSAQRRSDGAGNLTFFLAVATTSFLVWVVGTGVGFGIALGVPTGFGEGLKFILPGYFAGLMVVEMRGWTMPLICLASLVAAVPGASFSSEWGWIATAMIIAMVGSGLELWTERASASS